MEDEHGGRASDRCEHRLFGLGGGSDESIFWKHLFGPEAIRLMIDNRLPFEQEAFASVYTRLQQLILGSINSTTEQRR